MSRPATATGPADYYVVHVVDEIDSRVAGREGCSYISPPHTPGHALELVCALLGCPSPAASGP